MSDELIVKDDTFFKSLDRETLKKLTPQEQAYTLMRANGSSKKEAYKSIGGKGKHVNSIVYNMEKRIKSKSIVNPKMVKLAHTAVMETLEMKPVTVTETVTDREGESKTIEKNIYPSHANRLDAAKLILSRSEPEIQKHMNLNVEVKAGRDLIDLSGYMDDEPETIIDVPVSEMSQKDNVSKDVESHPKGL